MEYAQLNEDGTDAIHITSYGNMEWDSTHFCPTSSLTEEEAILFRVVPLIITEPPVINQLTHTVFHDGCEQVEGQWQYKWRVNALTSEQMLENLTNLKASKIIAIKAERDRRKLNGVFVSDKWFNSDTYSRTQWIGMAMMGADVPAILWTTMDNTTVMTSQTLVNAVFQATAQLDTILFAYAKSLIEAVEASDDPTNIDITIGWPATYEGDV